MTKYKIVWKVHSHSPDFWGRVKAWQDFKVWVTHFRVYKIPVWWSYSKFVIVRFEKVKRKFLWFKWESIKKVVALNEINHYRWLHNWSSLIVPWRDTFISIFENFLLTFEWRIKTIVSDDQEIDK